MATSTSYSKDSKAIGGPVRKKLKTSDLPLASATRAAIEGLAHTFKKKGGYDSLRKQVWDDLEGSDFEAEFTRSLLKVAEDELEKNPSGLLKLDRGKATLLIEGAVDRAGVYQSAEARIDHLIDAHIEEIETGIRALREEDIGKEAAAAEQAKGGKTDEQYAEEAAKKRAAREKIREDLREKEREILEEKRKMERARRKEEERKIEEEQERKKEEREARKKAEREREEERERQRDRDRDLRDRDRERDSHRDRRDRSRDRDRDRERARDRDRDDRNSRYGDDSRRESTRDIKEVVAKADLSKEEVARIEEEALNDLLKEGKRVAQRSSRHQLDLEVDDTLAPPPRKLKSASAILPKDSLSLSAEVRKSSSSSTKPKVDDGEFKVPTSTAKIYEEDKTAFRDKRSSHRSRSRDRASTRRSSRSRSRRRRDSRDRRSSVSKLDDGEVKDIDSKKDREDRHRSRRDSRDRDDRHRRNSRDRDDRHRRDSRDRDDKRRRSSKERDYHRHRTRSRSPSRDRRRSYRSRSRERKERETARDLSPTTHRPLTTNELWKLAETKKREEEARAYLAAQNEARAKGLPIPGGWNDRAGQVASTPRHRPDDRITSPVSNRKRDSSRDRDRDRDHERSSRVRSRSRSPARRRSRIERSTSPVNIDRYVPGGGSHRHKSAIAASPSRKRDRSRDADRESRRSRDDDKPRRRSRSRSRRRDRTRERDRSRDRDRKARSRTRSPRRERDSKRDRSRSRDKDRERRRERSRSRDRDRDRDRKRSRSRGSRRDSRRE